MWTFIVVGIGAIGAFAIGNRLVEVLLIPFPDDIEVVQIDILEGIRVRMKIALLGGIVVAFPMILYQAVMFVRPALSRTEKTFLYVSLPITSGPVHRRHFICVLRADTGDDADSSRVPWR